VGGKRLQEKKIKKKRKIAQKRELLAREYLHHLPSYLKKKRLLREQK